MKITTAGSSNQIAARLRTDGAKYDIVSASADIGRLLIAGKDVAPIDVALVPAWNDLFAALKSPAATTVAGRHYGVATQWTPNTLLYNTRQVKPVPTSWRAIYNQVYRGKISVPNNPMQIADAGLYLMKEEPSLGIRDPYELTKPQLAAVVSLLQKQKSLVGGYWNYPSEQVEDFKNGKAVVGSTLAVAGGDTPGVGRPGRGHGSRAGSDRLDRLVDDLGAREASGLRIPLAPLHVDARGAGAALGVVRRIACEHSRLPADERDPEGFLRRAPR